jgi:phospholipid transport system substrate-binding protein
MNITSALFSRRVLAFLLVICVSSGPGYAATNDDPAAVIDSTVQSLFDEFTASRERLELNKTELFVLVNDIASPLFDFNYISKLVLAKSWKNASEQQKTDFAIEFKRLLIVTYATALFQYTGKETMSFGETGFREKKGVKLAKVNTEVFINEGAPISVVYDMIKKADGEWKIYNLTVGDLNMVLNYRNVIQSSIQSDGLDALILSMKENNQKHYQQ